MRNKYSFRVCLSGLLFLLMLSGCQKFVQIPASPDSIISSQLFSDSVDAVAALTGIYIAVMKNSNSLNAGNGDMTLYPGMAADELNAPYPGSDAEFINNNITLTNQAIEGIWSSSYNFIYEANACIEGVAASSTLSQSLKNRITGEAKFFRSFFLLNLTNVFGGVPLVQTSDYKVTAKLGRTSVPDVYTALIADLQSADSLLSAGTVSVSPVHISRYAVEALLARVYLYNSNWDKAEQYANKVINGGYTLPNNLDSVFLNGSSEAILQILPTYAGDETVEGNYFVPYSFTFAPNYMLADQLINAFEPGDLRKDHWTSSFVAGNTYVIPYKYKLRSDYTSTAPPSEAYMWLRLGEQYLIRAEARAQQGNTAGAIADLDVLRTRAGLSGATASTQADVLKAVQHERQVELFCEWGHRWIDLKRTNTIEAVLGTEKPGWKSTDALFPIPNNEINTNPFLTPNPS
jgi:hypothetical protein